MEVERRNTHETLRPQPTLELPYYCCCCCLQTHICKHLTPVKSAAEYMRSVKCNMVLCSHLLLWRSSVSSLSAARGARAAEHGSVTPASDTSSSGSGSTDTLDSTPVQLLLYSIERLHCCFTAIFCWVAQCPECSILTRKRCRRLMQWLHGVEYNLLGWVYIIFMQGKERERDGGTKEKHSLEWSIILKCWFASSSLFAYEMHIIIRAHINIISMRVAYLKAVNTMNVTKAVGWLWMHVAYMYNKNISALGVCSFIFLYLY